MPSFVDSHAHIFYPEYGDDLDEVLSRAAAAGVAGIICPGTNLATSAASVALAEKYPAVRAAVGFHPHEAAAAGDDALQSIERMSAGPGVVAIGEIGLDYHYDFAPRDVQRDVFRKQIAIARRRALPVIIHSREAEEDTIAIVEGEIGVDPAWRGLRGDGPPARGVFHCFPGDAAMARRVIDLGFYVSFPGPLTFPVKPAKPNLMAEVASAVPLERVLLETDSPYLSPHPHRGTRNEPARVAVIAARLSELTGRTLAEIGAVTSRNVELLFGFSAVGKR